MEKNLNSNENKSSKIWNGVKALGINGSPRMGGNTDILLDKVLEGARSKGTLTEKVILNELKFSPCQECENIKDDGGCILGDDMQQLYDKIRTTDVLIIASPIFFGSLTAQTKMMIDRFQCTWKAKFVLKKDIGYKKVKGAFISVEGSDRRDFFENAKAIIKNLFAIINVDYKAELFCSRIDDKGDIQKRTDCLEKAFKLGVKMVS
ncbi:MAG: flavodoxin family protein [Candidatus Omnitrophica bacterium]|nr:flavodoxin family protein [Candidatus Omnitrophota bacterium]